MGEETCKSSSYHILEIKNREFMYVYKCVHKQTWANKYSRERESSLILSPYFKIKRSERNKSRLVKIKSEIKITKIATGRCEVNLIPACLDH